MHAMSLLSVGAQTEVGVIEAKQHDSKKEKC